MKKLKNYFLAGLIAILPLWITYYIVYIVFDITAGFARPYFRTIPFLAHSPQLLNLISFIGTILIIVFLGILLTNVFGRRIFLWLEKSLEKIPLLSGVYTSIRKLTKVFYSEEPQSRFQRVVLVEYPKNGTYVIGFMTSDVAQIINQKVADDLVNVFLPTTPNPTSGFLLLVPKKDVIPLEITTEDAIKLVMSGGLVAPQGDL